MMKVAIVGAGISGLTCAYLLDQTHEVTVFEVSSQLGGHTHTVLVEEFGNKLFIDMGFIVFNSLRYPYFSKLLERLQVSSIESDMGFSLRDDPANLEYRGADLKGFFSQRRNLFRPSFIRMIGEIFRFQKESPAFLKQEDDSLSILAYLKERNYSKWFIEKFLFPMGAAIWSSGKLQMENFPAKFFIQFFHHHGFLSVKRPVWRVVSGGSHSYVRALSKRLKANILISNPVESVRRDADKVIIDSLHYKDLEFDKVIFANHSDQAFKILKDKNAEEETFLNAISFQSNEVVLHTDSSVMPKRKRAWASWNYFVSENQKEKVLVTYYMNKLQSLQANKDYFVSLNQSDVIDSNKIIKKVCFSHPIFTPKGMRQQKLLNKLNGKRNTFFCGAYCGFGFHEDGVNSARAVCQMFDVDNELKEAFAL